MQLTRSPVEYLVTQFGNKSFPDLALQFNCFTIACICLNSGVPAGHNSNKAISTEETIAPAFAILLIATSIFRGRRAEMAALNK